MVRYLLLRTGRGLVTLLGITIFVFLLTHALGDPAVTLLPADVSNEVLAYTRESLGLNKPLHEQFADFVGNALRGDFGNSLHQRVSSRELLVRALGPTLMLALTSMAIVVALGVTAGVVAARRPGSWLDRFVTTVSTMGIAMPEFWLALVLIILVGVTFRLLPTSGYGSWQNLVLPAVTLSARSIARVAQLTRSSMLDEIGRDYVRTAYSKGLRDRQVVIGHVLRNAGLPIITTIGIEAAELFAGRTVIVETVFGWPGVGALAGGALFAMDFPLIQTVVLWAALVTVLVNLLVDLSYGWFDPRIRYA